MSNQSYVPPRINNGRPAFDPMGPVTVDPRTPVARTPIEPINVPRVPVQTDLSPGNITGQPNLTTAGMPKSQASPAVKPGR
jgi:hypothetical protein